MRQRLRAHTVQIRWCARRESNPLPCGPEPHALSDELRARAEKPTQNTRTGHRDAGPRHERTELTRGLTKLRVLLPADELVRLRGAATRTRHLRHVAATRSSCLGYAHTLRAGVVPFAGLCEPRVGQRALSKDHG